LLLAVVALVYDRLALTALHPPERVFDMIETLAAFVIVRDIFTAGQRYRFLLAPAVVTLGEISFSIYLLHLPIFLILFVAAGHYAGLQPLLDYPAVSQVSMSALTALVTIVISIFTYKHVELPMHNIGRRLARRISQKGKVERNAIQAAALHKAEPPLA
jgi:peptidoglycan/LPS O-acetylase OafA/YrhL